eukprot:6193189-Pleurochrysis_carterae.AAC.1
MVTPQSPAVAQTQTAVNQDGTHSGQGATVREYGATQLGGTTGTTDGDPRANCSLVNCPTCRLKAAISSSVTGGRSNYQSPTLAAFFKHLTMTSGYPRLEKPLTQQILHNQLAEFLFSPTTASP